jgi:ligand-binding sensor domain-containing protein
MCRMLIIFGMGMIKSLLFQSLVLVIGCFFITIVSDAQETNTKFLKLSTEQGISQSSVSCIFQDDEGFMWFGTYEGLNRYDGYNFIWHQFNYSNPLSSSDNHIRSVCKDTSGVFLVATINGLNRFFVNTREFIRFIHDPGDPASLSNNTVYKVLKDKQGNIWIGTWGGGLDKMVKVEGNYADEKDARYKFVHYLPDTSQNSISSLWITDITEDKDGSLWIGTNNGLNHFDKINNKLPVIALTAFALSQDKDKIMKAQFDNYLSKPINPERLWELLTLYKNKTI